jgi:hypothetical protein
VPGLDPAIRADDHADALRALGGIDVGAVRGADLSIGVTDQWEVEVELLGEGLVLGGTVERYAQDDRILGIVLRLQVAEPATFRGSPGRVGLRIEPQHDRLSLQRGQRDRGAGVIATRELRGFVAGLEHVTSWLER